MCYECHEVSLSAGEGYTGLSVQKMLPSLLSNVLPASNEAAWKVASHSAFLGFSTKDPVGLAVSPSSCHPVTAPVLGMAFSRRYPKAIL